MFEFGFAKCDITPARGVPLCGYFNPRPNKGMLDPLYVRVAAFRSDGDFTAIVSYDLCFITRALVNRIIAALDAAGVAETDKIMFSAIHTHTGPYTDSCFNNCTDEKYIEVLIEKSVLTVKDAIASLAPAELFGTMTYCDTLAYNRRFWMKDGNVLTNPGKLNPEIDRAEGPTDPEIPMLAVKQDGIYKMLLVNIVNHTDTIGGDFVSADWPGRMEHEVQHALGYDIPVITLVGAQGNINHFNVKTSVGQTSYEEACRIGKGYAAVILAAIYQLNKIEFSGIKVSSEEFEVPYRTVSDEEYAEAKLVIEANKDAVMEAGRDFTSEDIAKKNPYVMKLFAQMLVDCRDKAHTDKRIEKMMCIKFGDKVGFLSFPAEPFVEIGLGVKSVSPFPLTFIVGLAMGEVGYTAPKEKYSHGKSAYETSPEPGSVDVNVGDNMLAIGKKMIN